MDRSVTRRRLLLLSLLLLTLWLAGGASFERPRRGPWPTPGRTETAHYASTSERVRFAVVGDYGTAEPSSAAVAALVARQRPAFVATTGDNNYPSGAAATIEPNITAHYAPFLEPDDAGAPRFFPALGNHDWIARDAQPYLDYFDLPGNERYYDVRWGPLHLFVIDSDRKEPDGVSATSTQAQWLQREATASDAPWQIVLMHHPPYSSANHGSTAHMQWPFADWGIDAVLAGHDHTYERIERDGILYFVNGLGGRSPYDFRQPIEGSRLRFNEQFGAMLIEATPSTLAFEFITTEGEVIDQVTLGAGPGARSRR